jgi:hypothetical protein
MIQLAAPAFRGSRVKKFIVVAAAIAAFGLLDGASVGVSSGGFIYMIS